MDRIDDPTATPDRQFTEGDPTKGTGGTVVRALWLNNVQEELCNLITQLGIELDSAKTNQLFTAVSKLIDNKVTDTLQNFVSKDDLTTLIENMVNSNAMNHIKWLTLMMTKITEIDYPNLEK